MPKVSKEALSLALRATCTECGRTPQIAHAPDGTAQLTLPHKVRCSRRVKPHHPQQTEEES